MVDGGSGSTAQKRSDQWSPDGGATIPYNSGISLTAGQKYWLEGVHHDTGGGNNFEATFKGIYDADPQNGDDTKLAGDVIGIYVPRIPWVAFLQQPTDQIGHQRWQSGHLHRSGAPILRPSGSAQPAILTIGSPIRPPYRCSTSGIRTARRSPARPSSSYTQPYVLPSDQGAQFVCGMRALGYADDSLQPICSNSLPAVLTVVTDTVPPTVTYAAAFQNTNQIPPLNV